MRASADGAMLFDTTSGEAYAIRVIDKTNWQQFHVYRKVPSNGEVRVRLAADRLRHRLFRRHSH